MLRRAGLPVAALDHSDYRISADRVQVLLADSARSAGSEEFGLNVGACFKLSMLGPLGLLMREQATLRDAITALRRYLRYQDENIEIRLESRAGDLLVSPWLLSPRTRASRLMADMTLAMFVQAVRGLLHEGWRPKRTYLAHQPPLDIAPYIALFGSVEFGAPFTGFLVAAEDLTVRLPEADPEMAREIARFIEASAQPHNLNMTDTVAALIERLLPDGECSVDRVAQHLGVDRRTVHRRLAAEGRSFTQLLEHARREVATWQLSHGDQPLSEVTTLVGFSSLSTFSRWFRQAYGMQPSEYRRMAHTH